MSRFRGYHRLLKASESLPYSDIGLFRASVGPVGSPSPGPGERCLSTSLLVTTEEGTRDMAESVYKVIELVGTSEESWEKAASAAVTQAARTLRRPAHCGGGRARPPDRGRTSHGLPSQGQGVIQVRRRRLTPYTPSRPHEKRGLCGDGGSPIGERSRDSHCAKRRPRYGEPAITRVGRPSRRPAEPVDRGQPQ